MLFSRSILVSNYQTDVISFLAFFLLSIRVSFWLVSGLGFGLFYYLAILAKIKHNNMSVWQLETSIDRLKSTRASFPCQSLHL